MQKKKRADLLAFEQGLAASQEAAARLIMAGVVYRNGPQARSQPLRVEKAGEALPSGQTLFAKDSCPYVSRGAYKLLTALERFHIDVSGAVALDAGASTGGFTDCLLQLGARKVYAVDVGHNQLHEKLRCDPRVVSMESVNLRLAGPDLLPEPVDLMAADLSFISLRLVLPVCLKFVKKGGLVIALIKPQFEVPAEKTVRGVVRDPEVRQAAVAGIADFAERELGLALVGIVPSALKGPKGNQEFLACWRT